MAVIKPTFTQITSGLRFPEGPVAMPDGSVILVEIERRTLSRVTPDGKVHVVAKLGGGPNGAAIGPGGRIYVTNNGGLKFLERPGKLFSIGQADDYVTGSIQVVDPETGKFDMLYDSCDGRKLCGPNDLVFDRAGGFWFTDLGKTRQRDADRGAVYYAKADDGALLVFPPVRAGADRVGQRTLPGREGGGRRGPGRLSDVRLARRGQRRPHLRGHPDHGRGQRHLAGWQPGRSVHAARHDGDQRLLRWA